MFTRRCFLLGSLAAVGLAGCGKPSNTLHVVVMDDTPSRADSPRPDDPALARAADYLISKQSPDGTWRSDTYGMFKFGDALTPLCLNALLAAAAERREPIVKAANWLADFANNAGEIEEPRLGFEVAAYISALSVSAFSHAQCPKHDSARDAWLKYLRERQLTEALGWSPDDRQYGGWGYCRATPRKHQPGDLLTPPLLESNLSATTYALAALKAAAVPADDPTYRKALVFVKRNQNWQDEAKSRDSRFDDGGFFFIYDDPVRNKAGVAGQDGHGRERYHSYGSMTIDGLRCLDMCGQATSERRRAAANWLEKRFHPAKHPGEYADRRNVDRDAVYYYFAASMAESSLETWPVDDPKGIAARDWREGLATVVRSRQRPDGSWINQADLVRENEPLVATSFAMIALANLDKR